MPAKVHVADIIWAFVSDRRGNNSKLRPLLVIEVAGEHIYCLAISTDPKIDAKDPTIEIEWRQDGSATTGLLAWSCVVLKWAIWMDADQVKSISGYVTRTFVRTVLIARDRAIHAG